MVFFFFSLNHCFDVIRKKMNKHTMSVLWYCLRKCNSLTNNVRVWFCNLDVPAESLDHSRGSLGLGGAQFGNRWYTRLQYIIPIVVHQTESNTFYRVVFFFFYLVQHSSAPKTFTRANVIFHCALSTFEHRIALNAQVFLIVSFSSKHIKGQCLSLIIVHKDRYFYVNVDISHGLSFNSHTDIHGQRISAPHFNETLFFIQFVGIDNIYYIIPYNHDLKVGTLLFSFFFFFRLNTVPYFRRAYSSFNFK